MAVSEGMWLGEIVWGARGRGRDKGRALCVGVRSRGRWDGGVFGGAISVHLGGMGGSGGRVIRGI